MSNYTIELRYALGAVLNGKTELWVPTLDEYPIFDESYRATLNEKIINHYFFKEIGVETIERFDFNLKTKMKEIMPIYNKLYETETLTFNPLYNFNLVESNTRNINGTNSATSGMTGTNTNTINRSGEKDVNIESDTPGGNIAIASVETGGYASKVNINEHTYLNPETNVGAAENDQTSSGAAATTETFARTVTGFSGVNASEMLMKYRDTLMNIDMKIINELSDLFMQVY